MHDCRHELSCVFRMSAGRHPSEISCRPASRVDVNTTLVDMPGRSHGFLLHSFGCKAARAYATSGGREVRQFWLHSAVLESPSRHINLLKAVVWQSKELQHRENQVAHVRQQVCIVLHNLRADEKLPTPAELVELDAMVTGNERVLLPVNDQHRRPDEVNAILARESLLDEIGNNSSHCVAQEILDGQERRNENQTRDFVLYRKRDSRPCANGAAENLNAVRGPLQHLAYKSEHRKCVLCDRVCSGWAPRTDSIAWIFDCEDMHLELLANDSTETVAFADILCIAVQVQDQEPG
mmetsp:Transcript_143149/g.252648  ORF Transcript_143149/g.252648 Transcript_143149/m.252648 type:complete len:294 (+) Transcript_143149:195-1076(+)